MGTNKILSDKVLAFILVSAKMHMRAKKVLLFGSRARGDHRQRSDYDVAVDAPEASELGWLRFCDEVRENAPTLCSIDLLWLQQEISPDLRSSIAKEGRDLEQDGSRLEQDNG